MGQTKIMQIRNVSSSLSGYLDYSVGIGDMTDYSGHRTSSIDSHFHDLQVDPSRADIVLIGMV